MKKSVKTRIFVNLLCFPSEQLAGVGHFTRRLFQMLNASNTEGLIFELFYPAQLEVEKVFAVHPSLELRLHPIRWTGHWAGRIFYEQILLPFRCQGCDVFFSPVPAVPLLLGLFRRKTRIIPTIHDVIYERVKKKYPFWRRQYLRLLNRFSAQVADKIITVSTSSRHDIAYFLGVAPEKIVLVYNFLPEQQAADFAPIFDPYFLFIGTLEPGKNIENMLRGFHRLLEIPAFSDYHFYLVGKEGWHYASIYKLCQALGLDERVHFTGYLSPTEKEQLLSKTAALVLVSSYEGFGTPVLEALYAHKPSVVSQCSSLPEVAGPAGVFCDPDDISSIAQALQEVVERREELLVHIPQQLRLFDPHLQIHRFLQTLTP